VSSTVFFGCGTTLGGGSHRRGQFRALIACFLIAAVFGCSGGHESGDARKQQGPQAVTFVEIMPRDVPATFEYVAQIQSSRQVNIQARVNGFLDKRVYTEGAVVKEGQTLYIMDQKPFKAQVDQAKAALAQHEAALEVARLNLARVKPLAAANALSQKDLDDATGQFRSAAAGVEEAKASVEQAKLNLSYTVIAAPVTGITSYSRQAEGTYLSPTNNQLTTVAVITPVYVNFSISENDWLKYRSQIETGLLRPPKNGSYIAEIVLSDGSIYPHTGEVTFAAPSYDAQTGTFLIRATVENPDETLRPNQYVRIRLKGAVRPHATVVPQRAVQQSAKGHFVWVVDRESKAEQRPVVVGSLMGTDWLISDGLQAGDKVVVDGGLTLQPGAAVAAKAAGPGTGPAPAGGPPEGRPGNTDDPANNNRGRG
jgi:membrane fusion protein (multidrug efflux system)